jgi:putative membrane protein
MYFSLKVLHIAAMAIWFAGLFFLPRVLIARARRDASADDDAVGESGERLYFGLTTRGAAVTIILGIALLFYGFEGAWLPAKMILVALIVLLHVYFGKLLVDSRMGRAAHPSIFYRALNWLPLFLLLGIVALTAAKPAMLPPLGGI